MGHGIQPCVHLGPSNTTQQEARSHLHVLVCEMGWMCLRSDVPWEFSEMKRPELLQIPDGRGAGMELGSIQCWGFTRSLCSVLHPGFGQSQK